MLIGISEYELSNSLPENLQTSFPTIEEIEAELNERIDQKVILAGVKILQRKTHGSRPNFWEPNIILFS